MLSYTVLTSSPDLVLPLIRSGDFKSWAKGLSKYAADPEYREMIKRTGVAIENLLHDRQVGMYGADIKGHLGRAQTAFFNATLLTPWTDMNRGIAGAVGMESFRAMQKKAIRHMKGDGRNMAEQSRDFKTAARFLNRYGLGDYIYNGKSLEFDDVIESDDLIREAIIKFANEAIFAPNANDVPLWGQTPIGAMIFQLKSFPLMMARLGKDVAIEAKEGNIKPLLWYASAGPAAGAGALALKDILQFRGGEDNQEPALRTRNSQQFLQLLGYDKDLHGDEDDFFGWYFEGMMAMGGLGPTW
jgi:hypothetical protein